MYDHPNQMDPLMPVQADQLRDLAIEVIQKSAALSGSLHLITQESITGLLQIINSYYSNLIEGHSTHPIDIERAMRDEYEVDASKRALQIESRIHIELQQQIPQQLMAESGLHSASQDFILWIHKKFYERLPVTLRMVAGVDGEEVEVLPGMLREHNVEVGRHVAPMCSTLDAFMGRFETFYNPDRFSGDSCLIAVAASHHRLMWIHPFLDGNGRVTRLFTDACLAKIGVRGYGLWNVSRGLARNKDQYMAALMAADMARQGDLDGRGNLTNRGLIDFCRFFLETCIDQIDYMSDLLRLDNLRKRIAAYADMRSAGLLPGLIPGYDRMDKEAAYLLQEAFIRGEFARGEAKRITGRGERKARDILKQLLAEGLLISSTPKGPVRLGVPATVAGHWFPQLYPEQLV